MQKNSSKFPIEIVTDIFGESNVLADLVGDRKVLIVADMNVVNHAANIGTRIGSYVNNHHLALAGSPVVLGGGERAKMDNFQSAMRVADTALRMGLTNEDFILAIGGGAVLDVASWSAAQVGGGVKLIRVPTTPASMCGGAYSPSAGLNLLRVKDAIRVTSIPEAVLVDFDFAPSVLEGVWRAGIAEAVRVAAAHDIKVLKKIQPLVEAYRKQDLDAFREIATLAINLYKKKGWTDFSLDISRPLEPRSGWKLPNGYAITIGILIAMYQAVQAGERKQEELDLVIDILRVSGAIDGARHSKHILPHELAVFW